MKRNTLLKIWCVVIVYLINILSLFSFAEGNFSVKAGEVSKIGANSIRVPVIMSNNHDIRGMQFDFAFNRNLLSLKNVSIGELPLGFTQINKMRDTYFRIIVYNLSAKTFQKGTGSVVNIDFDIKNGAKKGDIANFDFSNVVISGADSVNLTNLAVISGKSFTISGDMFPYLPATSTTAVPNNSGNITPTPAGSLRPAITPSSTAGASNSPRASNTARPTNTPFTRPASTPSPVRSVYTTSPTPKAKIEAWELMTPVPPSPTSQVKKPNNNTLSDDDDSGIINLDETRVLENEFGSYKVNEGEGDSTDTANLREADLAVILSVDSLKYEEDAQVKYKIRYINKSNSDVPNVKIRALIPENTMAQNINGGKINPGSVEWTIPLLSGKQKGEISYTVRVLRLPSPQVKITNEVFIEAGGFGNRYINKEDDKSKISTLFYKKGDETLSHENFVSGFPDRSFKPDKLITRAEFAAVVSNILDGFNSEDEAGTSIEFLDLPQNHWAYMGVKKVSSRGLFKGGLDGRFNPESNLTRGELSVVVSKLLGTGTGYFDRYSFSDSAEHWARNFIEEAFRNNIISGFKDGKFMADKAVSRAEAVTIISKLLFRGPLITGGSSFVDVPSSHWASGYIEEAATRHSYTMGELGKEIKEE